MGCRVRVLKKSPLIPTTHCRQICTTDRSEVTEPFACAGFTTSRPPRCMPAMSIWIPTHWPWRTVTEPDPAGAASPALAETAMIAAATAAATNPRPPIRLPPPIPRSQPTPVAVVTVRPPRSPSPPSFEGLRHRAQWPVWLTAMFPRIVTRQPPNIFSAFYCTPSSRNTSTGSSAPLIARRPSGVQRNSPHASTRWVSAQIEPLGARSVIRLARFAGAP